MRISSLTEIGSWRSISPATSRLTNKRFGVLARLLHKEPVTRINAMDSAICRKISRSIPRSCGEQRGTRSESGFGRDSFGNRSKRQGHGVGERNLLQYDTDPRRSATAAGAPNLLTASDFRDSSVSNINALADHLRATPRIFGRGGCDAPFNFTFQGFRPLTLRRRFSR